MNNETEKKFRSELHSFFGLIMLNMLTVFGAVGLGVALTVMMLIQGTLSEDIIALPLALLPLGVLAIAYGVYWLIQTIELTRGVTDIYRTYEALPAGEDVPVTALMIKMTALYRANQPLIKKMKILGTVGGVAIIALGVLLFTSELGTIMSSGFVIDNIDRLINGSIAIAVGVAGLLTARYFSIYSQVWDARMVEAAKIEDVLKRKLEGI